MSKNSTQARRGRPVLSKAEKARRQKAREAGQAMPSKIDQVREIFSQHLPNVGKVDRVTFRRAVLNDIVANVPNTTENNAATMYNTAKKEAEAAGRLAPGQVGLPPRQAIEVDPDQKWVLITRMPTAQFDGTREEARAHAGPCQSVIPTKQWLKEVGEE